MGLAAPVIGAVIGLAGSVYQANQAKRAQHKADSAQADMMRQQTALQSQYRNSLTDDGSGQAIAAARQRQLAFASGNTGQNQNIATSPIGLTGAAPTASKALIGQ